MARSFAVATPALLNIEDFSKRNKLDHAPSGDRFEMLRRGDHFFQRRYQLGYQGREENALELEIHYVLGSGHASRSYIHRRPDNRLVELPVAWYTENGGYWAMSPGFDRADHLGFRRSLTDECMACHNGYPAIPEGASRSGVEATFPPAMPEGIDCQRCHGPGGAHIEAAQRSDKAALAKTIVNPARLDRDRQLEVCMQCHLETTSFSLPNSIVRFDRSVFAYRAGDPLGDHISHFDHAPGTGHDDKFEIVSAAYRLRQSACFRRSETLTCTTCHHPHGTAANYDNACKGCHASLSAKHPAAKSDCASCHMPKRRTEDVVHAAVTDHRIQRTKPAGDLLAPRRERSANESAYAGEVAPYYPANPPELYLALAQVMHKSNIDAGIPRLERAIALDQPKQPEFYLNLAQAWIEKGRRDRAIDLYREALRRDERYSPALRGLGFAQLREGRVQESIEVLERARGFDASNAGTHHDLARAYQAAGRRGDAIASAREAVRLQADFTEAQNTLGGLLLEAGDRAGAEQALRESLRWWPRYGEAHENMANFFLSGGDAAQAEYHCRRAVELSPGRAEARLNHGIVLAGLHRFADAAEAFRKAAELNPKLDRAYLGLGMSLAALRDLAGAKRNLERAAAGMDAAVRQEALDVLRELAAAPQ